MPFTMDSLADPQRLQVLQETGLLDAAEEASLDRLTRLAAFLLHTPLALVNAIDNTRQWTKSAHMPADWTMARQASLSDSFCKYPVISRTPLIIEDTREEALVANSAFIPQFSLHAYAAMPLITADGFALGTLCVADTQPRQWSESELTVLYDLAQAVVTEVELRRELVRRTQVEQELLQRTATITLLHAMAADANAASSFDEALQIALRHLIDHTGWLAAFGYRIDSNGAALHPEMWYAQTPSLIEQLPERRDLRHIQETLHYQVLNRQQPCWIPDLRRDWPGELHPGLQAATAFPVSVGERIGAIIIVLDDQPHSIRSDLVQLMQHISSLLRPVFEREEHAEMLRIRALVDPTTGLYNRNGFLSLAEQQCKLAQRYNHGLLLFFIDMDGLKYINDTLGHGVGDLALREVSDVLQSAFRSSDILARLGGDEFVVLSIVTPETSSEQLLQRLQTQLREYNQQPERQYKLAFSIGVAQYDPHDPVPIEELLRSADQAMYQQKHNKGAGRQSVALPPVSWGS